METATAHHEHQHPAEQHQVWLQSFSDEDRQEQIHEDAEAWKKVTGLLFGVVAIGLVIAVLAVWISGKL